MGAVCHQGGDSEETRRRQMLRLTSAKAIAAAILSLGLGIASTAQAQGKQLTLCWAAWDPANALVELSKDFTAKTGIAMKFEFVPWTSYADRFINELNSHGKLCDLSHSLPCELSSLMKRSA